MKIAQLSLAVELIKNNYLKNINSIMDMGTKTLRVKYDSIKYLFEQANYNFDKNKFSFLKKFPKGNRESTKLFWNSIGIKNYNCIDINKVKGSIYADLNIPFEDKEHFSKYDLVCDFGNNEHVFNVGEAYRTMYNLCKKNGYIWVTQSVYGGNGFFNFDLSFFENFALANNLSIVYSAYLVNLDNYEQFLIPANKVLFEALDLNKINNIDITYIFRKTDNKKFNYGYQFNLKSKDHFKTLFYSNFYPSEKVYIQSKSISKIKKLAKKGDKVSINWCRDLNIKF